MADMEKDRRAIEALRASLRGKLPAQLLHKLRVSWGGSRKEFATYVAKKVRPSPTGPIWSEDTVKHLEIGKTPFKRGHLDNLRESGIFQLLLYPEVWTDAFDEALKAQTASVSVHEAPEQPPSADLPKTPLRRTIGVEEGQPQAEAVPASEEVRSSQPPGGTQSREAYQGTKQVKPRYTRWLPYLALLLIIALGGSCAIGIALNRLMEERGLVDSGQPARVITTTPPATSEPQVVYQVVTATPGPVTVAPTQPTAPPQVVTRVVTSQPEIVYQVVTATPEPITATPRATATHTPQPTVIPLPFEDDFDRGARREWQQVTGVWRMVEGAYWADPSGSWSIALVGDDNWKDYAVDVDVIYNDWNTPDVRIIVRAVGNSYMAFQTHCCDSIWLLVSDGQAREIATSNNGGLRGGLSGSSHLRVEAKGNLYTAYSEGNRLLMVQDDTLSAGRAGLSVVNDSYRWRRFDNFKVTALQ
jgi:hypothetical protein